MAYKTLKERLAENALKPCNHPGCERPRTWTAQSCIKHFTRYRRFGSTYGRILYPERDMPREMNIVQHLLSLNRGNAAIKLAIDWIMEITLAAHRKTRQFGILDPHLDNLYKQIDMVDIEQDVIAPMVALILVERQFYSPPFIEGMNLEWRDRAIGFQLIRAGRKRLVKIKKPRGADFPAHIMASKLIWDSIGQLLVALAAGAEALQKKLDQQHNTMASIHLNTDPEPGPEQPTDNRFII